MSFIASKIFWVFASPGNGLALALLCGAFLAMARGERWRAFGRRLVFAVAVLFFLIGIFPVGAWMLAPLENRFPSRVPDHVDGIIILGGDEQPRISEARGQPVFLDSGRRYLTFAALARQYPQAKLVYTGGTALITPDSVTRQTAVARQALAGIGVPVERMVFEDVSRNTRENAVMSFTILQPKPTEVWLLVTSAYHMPRSMAVFRKAGWNVVPAAAGYMTDGTYAARLDFNLGQHLLEMGWAAHEYYGLLAYRLMGYTDALWPE